MFTDDDDGRHTMTSDYDTTVEVCGRCGKPADDVLGELVQDDNDDWTHAGCAFDLTPVCEWCGEPLDESGVCGGDACEDRNEMARLRTEVARLTAELADVKMALADRLETAGLVCEWCGEGDDEGDEGLGMVVDGMHEACLTSSIEGGMATVLGRTNPST